VLETVGNASISTAVSKYGGSSMYFDGTNSYLSTLTTPTATFQGGNFTIEGWFYTSTVAAGNGTLFILYGTTADYIQIYRSTANIKTAFRTSGSTITTITGTTTLSANTWYHFAFVRVGGTVYQYINGTQDATGSISGDFDETGSTVTFRIGTNQSGTELFSGYIQDFRITKGYARYAGNFTPPTSLLQNQ